MNIAFPALFVLLLLLPGILLSYSYRRGFFQRSPVTLGPIRNEIGRGIVWALLIHPVVLSLLWSVGVWSPDPDLLLALTGGTVEVSSETVSTQFRASLWYLVGTNLSAPVVGGLAHKIVRANRLDLRYDWLRFSNEWHYLFSGEARVFQVDQEDRTVATIKEFLDWDFSFVFVSVIVSTGEESTLYWGVLSDFYFDSAGQLEKIVLEDAQRRPLRADTDASPDDETGARERELPPASERFYPIRGEYLVLRYENIQTLNVEYKVVDEA